MYNETLYEVENVVQIRWVKSNSLYIQIASTVSSSGEAMMKNSTHGNPKTTSPSATTMKRPQKKMMTLNMKKKCLSAILLLTTTRQEAKTNLFLNLLRPRRHKRRKITLNLKNNL
jgi:hypothetical protein